MLVIKGAVAVWVILSERIAVPDHWEKRKKERNTWGEHITEWWEVMGQNSNGHWKKFPPGLATVNNNSKHTQTGAHNAPAVWVGGVASQQLSGAAYGVSNWVEQHSWRTLVQDLASSYQFHNPQPSSAHPPSCILCGWEDGWYCLKLRETHTLSFTICFACLFVCFISFWFSVISGESQSWSQNFKKYLKLKNNNNFKKKRGKLIFFGKHENTQTRW